MDKTKKIFTELMSSRVHLEIPLRIKQMIFRTLLLNVPKKSFFCMSEKIYLEEISTRQLSEIYMVEMTGTPLKILKILYRVSESNLPNNNLVVIDLVSIEDPSWAIKKRFLSGVSYFLEKLIAKKCKILLVTNDKNNIGWVLTESTPIETVIITEKEGLMRLSWNQKKEIFLIKKG